MRDKQGTLSIKLTRSDKKPSSFQKQSITRECKAAVIAFRATLRGSVGFKLCAGEGGEGPMRNPA